MTFDDKFETLRATKLHLLQGAQWDAYDAEMSSYLLDPQPDVRAAAVERLMMAILGVGWHELRNDADRVRNRTRWLLVQIEMAQAKHADVLPAFLKGLRWHGKDDIFLSELLPWLDRIAAMIVPGVPSALVEGARILLLPLADDPADQVACWTALLDHHADWVRGCAARRLGDAMDEDSAQHLIDLIAAKEIEQPGIAGPFCSDWVTGDDFENWGGREPFVEWLFAMLDRRRGPLPSRENIPFNDIDFYLHELCAQSPVQVQRMIDGGFLKLAYMTATEDRSRIADMLPLIEVLASCSDADVACAANTFIAGLVEGLKEGSRQHAMQIFETLG